MGSLFGNMTKRGSYGVVPGNGNPKADDKQMNAGPGHVVPHENVESVKKIVAALGYDPNWKQYNDELRDNAGGKYHFVKPFPCTIVKAKGWVRPFHLELIVDSDSDLRKLNVPGVLPLFGGDDIIAYIDLATTENEIDNRGNETSVSHYVEGELEDEETPVKIDKLNDEGGIIATYIIKKNYPNYSIEEDDD